jgi:hypothetical protein
MRARELATRRRLVGVGPAAVAVLAVVLTVFAAFAAGATSALLVPSGVYLLVYWLPTLLGDDTARRGGAVGGTIEDASAAVANFLAAHTGAFAIGLAVAVAAGVALTAARRLPTAQRRATRQRRPPRQTASGNRANCAVSRRRARGTWRERRPRRAGRRGP